MERSFEVLVLPVLPQNFTATYIPDDENHNYRLRFDHLPFRDTEAENWSGGLPVLRYEWGRVADTDTIGSDLCPTTSFPDGQFEPTTEQDSYTTDVDLPISTNIAIRAVTDAGNGNCSVAITTGNPTPDDNGSKSDDDRNNEGKSDSATPPQAPTSLTASISNGNIVLTWNQPADKTVTGYLILRRRPREGERQLKVYVSNTESKNHTYTDTDAPSGTAYVYRVKALNSNGDESSVSNFVKVDHG